MGFHPVAAVGRLGQKQEKESYIQREKNKRNKKRIIEKHKRLKIEDKYTKTRKYYDEDGDAEKLELFLQGRKTEILAERVLVMPV